MLKNISIRAIALGAVLLSLPQPVWAGSTQIVVQWLDEEHSVSTFQLFRLQTLFDERAQQNGFDSDGNDVGGGTTNFYFHADDKQVDSAVRTLVSMRAQNLVPAGIRIGVAVYKNEKRDDWTYRPVYPETLKNFDITYRK